VNLRIGAIALGLLAVTACSLSGNSSQSNNPLAGVTIVQPSPTAPPTATPVPTPTPTPAPDAVEALTDTGFESGGFAGGWTACSIPHAAPSSTATPFPAVSAAVVGAAIVSATSPSFQVTATPNPANTPAIYAGTYSAFTYSGTGAQTAYLNAAMSKTGPAGANGICQTFTVPTSASLTMYVNEGGSDTGLNYADQEADIVTSGGTTTNLFFELNDPPYAGTDGATAGGTWVERGPYALTGPPYNLTPGESVTLFIGSFDSYPSAKYGVYMFVDNVTVTGFATAASSKRGSAPALRTRTVSH
jgi:hypothetical protein